MNEKRWAYHATSGDALPSIRQKGLIPRFGGSHYSDDDVSDGKVFFTHRQDEAEAYGAARPNAAVLRFPWPADAQLHHNPYGRAVAHAVQRTVPVHHLEVLGPEGWRPLMETPMTKAEQQTPPWLGAYPVTDADHHPQLEAAAAVHEMRGGLHREAAEQKAHADYKRERALEASAHHFLGIKAAHAAEAYDAAREHGLHYAASMAAAGLDPHERPPAEVLDRVKAIRHQVYGFKKHPADALFPVEEEAADGADAQIAADLGRLQKMVEG